MKLAFIAQTRPIDMTDKKQPVSYYFQNGGVRPGKKYKPNRVSLFTRIYLVVIAILIFTGATNEFLIQDSRAVSISSAGVQIHSMAGLMFYAGMVCVCVLMLAYVVDHYDKRNNEEIYALLAENLLFAIVCFFVLAMIMLITNYNGSLKEIPKILIFFLPIAYLMALMLKAVNTRMKENETKFIEWNKREIQDLKNMSTGSEDNAFSFIGHTATTMQYTETPLGDEHTLTGLEVKRILRNHWGEYFYWVWSSRSKPYLKHITQVNARIILKEDYIEPK